MKRATYPVTALVCAVAVLHHARASPYWYDDPSPPIVHQFPSIENTYVPEKTSIQPLQEANWRPTLKLGEVVGVAVDRLGDPVILHRAGRVWTPSSFNATHQMEDTTRLADEPVVTLDQYTAQQKRAWGAGLFLMPHGITIDREGHIWITDVGLHQVIKFSGVNHHPLLTLGQAETPGTDEYHFCQPTSTAVSYTGDVFVADGYCNNRVLRFTATGDFVAQFGSTGPISSSSLSALHLPHGIALAEPLDVVCLADREGRRVACYNAGLFDIRKFGDLVVSIPDVHNRRVFDVVSLGDGTVLGVGGSAAEGTFGIAFTADIITGAMLALWQPRQGLHNPHAIAVSPDGSALYIAELSPNTVWKFVAS